MSVSHPFSDRLVTLLCKPFALMGSAAAMLALATPAHAVVVVSPAAGITVPLSNQGIYVNVVTGASGTSAVAGWDINPWGTTSQTSPLIFDDPTTTLSNAYVISVGGQVASLSIGSVVGASAPFGSGSATTTAATSYWVLNATNYFGFRYVDEADGRLHYGYGTMAIGSSLQIRTIGNLYYESVAGAPITIGAVSAVPEPATWASLLAGLAVAGTVARRRSRAA